MNPDPWQMRGGTAAYALATIAQNARMKEPQRHEPFGKALSSIIVALNDADDGVCQRAVAVLYRLDVKAKQSGPALIRVLQNPKRSPTLRAQAAQTLGVVSRGGAPVVQALTAALQDPASEVQNAAINALGRCGPSARDALPALRRFLSHNYLAVRQAAGVAINRITTGE